MTPNAARPSPRVIWLLITMAALNGLGSFLFNTFANAWSEYVDTFPIRRFVALYIFTAIHRIGGIALGRLAASALAMSALVTVVFLVKGECESTSAPGAVNGSGQYAPALAAFIIFAALNWRSRHPMQR